MEGYIQGKDFVNLKPMLYWSFSSSYSGNKTAEVRNLVFSNEYSGALKVDGYYQRVIKDEDGNIFMVSREGKDKHEWVPHLNPFFNSLPNGTCLICECYLPGNEGSRNITSLLGCLKEKCIARQEKGQKLHLYVFDVCAWNGESWMNKPAKERFDFINNFKPEQEYIEVAQYYKGPILWEMLSQYLQSGREGIVITRDDCIVYEKRTPARMTIKVKKELTETRDVVIMGANPPERLYHGDHIEDWKYWQDINTGEKIEGEKYFDYQNGAMIQPISKKYFYNYAGSLKIGAYKNGELVQVGSVSGIEESVLEKWRDYVGTVVEVQAMEIFVNGDEKTFRHPKLIAYRPDKRPEECEYELI